MLEIGLILVKHLIIPVLIYMIVSSWSISQGVDPTIANIIAAACGFGTFIVSIKFGGTAYIPFKKNATCKTGGALWKKAYHYFQLHRDEFDRHYHQRSNAEATFAAIKKKFGETIKSRNRVAQENEMLCKIIAYNITVLIHAMFELEITPDFFKIN